MEDTVKDVAAVEMTAADMAATVTMTDMVAADTAATVMGKDAGRVVLEVVDLLEGMAE